jgi:hypothetical protein
MTTVITVFFAGLWGVLWHLLGYFALCALGVAWFIFSPFQKTWGLVFAGVVALGLLSFASGVSTEKARCNAQIVTMQKATVKRATKAQKKGETSAESSKRDPRDDQ